MISVTFIELQADASAKGDPRIFFQSYRKERREIISRHDAMA